MHYNFCRIHKTLRVTPAMAAGVTDKLGRLVISWLSSKRGRLRMPDYSKWPYRHLLEEEKKWGQYDMNAIEVRAEIQRRRENWKTWGIWIGFPCAVIAAIATVANFFLHSN